MYSDAGHPRFKFCWDVLIVGGSYASPEKKCVHLTVEDSPPAASVDAGKGQLSTGRFVLIITYLWHLAC